MLREVAFVQRFKQKSMYRPSAKKVAILERLERVNVWTVGQKSGPFRDVAVRLYFKQMCSGTGC